MGDLPERVERRTIPEIAVRWLRKSVGTTGVSGTPAMSTVLQQREREGKTVGVAVYFMDTSDQWFATYTIPPISKDEAIGGELEDRVPFEYWRQLIVRPEIGNISSTWLEVYNVDTGLNAKYTEVMGVLNDIQQNMFADLRPGKASRLVFCLKIKEGFQIPRDISDSALYRRREPGDVLPFLESSAALLDKLKMLTDSSEIYK